jgi:mono/diheme cytochrome c family protein
MTEILAPKPAVAEGGGGRGGRGGRGGAAAPAAAADPGKQVLESSCTQCHSLSRVETKNLAKPDWQDIVDRMKGKGVDISESDTSTLVDYLVKTYGPK